VRGRENTYGGQPGRTGNASREVVAGTDSMNVFADPADVESVTVRYLMYVLLPAWFVPGIADYVMRRRTRIERTSGLGNRRFTRR
jgi:hypothetical protein